jgi:hypothetical protein
MAGTSCSGHGAPITTSKSGPSFKRKGDTWTRSESWGCGCPTAPVFTFVYEPKTSPLRVRVCSDPSADRCEMMCQQDLSWDLSSPLKDAGAKDVTFVD